MELAEPNLAASASPGQFVMVAVNQGSEPFLRRPFSIAGVDKDLGVIRLIYQTVGKGSALMAAWESGRRVDVLGPLGNGFSLDGGFSNAILVGGGIGTAPLLPLAKELRAHGKDVNVFVGAASIGRVFGISQFNEYGCKVQLATEDGSGGMKGFVTLALEEHLQRHFLEQRPQGQHPQSMNLHLQEQHPKTPQGQHPQDLHLQELHLQSQHHQEQHIQEQRIQEQRLQTPQSQTSHSQPPHPNTAANAPIAYSATTSATPPTCRLFACGPTPFLRAVAALCRRYALDAQLSMEERMGCGMGACMGCAILIRDSAGEIQQKRVCYDGPVFSAEEVYYG
jgi:NAD(P)H-flavin reductase